MLYQRCPVADGLVDTVGSEADTVVSVKVASVAEIPVKLEPSPSLLSSVPVASGSVIVLFVLVLGAVTVSVPVPLACPCIFTIDVYLSYTIAQALPVGTVTAIPVLIVIGPAVIALLPLVML